MCAIEAIIADYIETTFGAEPQHPFAKYPDCTAYTTQGGKWFALLLTAKRRYFGLSGEGDVRVIDLKADPGFVALMAGRDGVYHGYHMNKAHWISVLLDGSVPAERIFPLIDASYRLLCDTPTDRIYRVVRALPYGRAATYGQVAAMAGNPGMSRAVGNAMRKNPYGEDMPCFKVLNAKGELSPEAIFGPGVQEALLRGEGIEVRDGRVDLSVYGITAEEMEKIKGAL